MSRPDRISQILRKFELSAERWFERPNRSFDDADANGASRATAEPTSDEGEVTSHERLEIDLNEGTETHEVSGEMVVLDWDDIEFIDEDESGNAEPDPSLAKAERVTARLRRGAPLRRRLHELADEAAGESFSESDPPAKSAGAGGKAR